MSLRFFCLVFRSSFTSWPPVVAHLAGTHLAFRNAFVFHGNKVLKTFLWDFGGCSCCRFVGCTSIMWLSCSTTSHGASPGLRSGGCKGLSAIWNKSGLSTQTTRWVRHFQPKGCSSEYFLFFGPLAGLEISRLTPTILLIHLYIPFRHFVCRTGLQWPCLHALMQVVATMADWFISVSCR